MALPQLHVVGMLLVASVFPLLGHCLSPFQEALVGAGAGVKNGEGARKSRSGPLDEAFDRVVEDAMGHFHVPGLSIAVVDGEETFAKGYGTAVFPSTKATPDTLYYVGSTTKSFTAASILLLIEDSANGSAPVTLQTPVSSLIRTEFVLPDAYATEKATLEDLLSHRTGMPRHDMSYGGARQPTLRQMVENLRNLPTTAELRTEWQYCNMMFSTLSYVLEKLTAVPLGALFKERIWRPLRMESTFFSIGDAQTSANASLSAGYVWDGAARAFVREPYLDSAVVSGAGAVISSVADYARYLRAMLTRHPFLTPASHAELRTARIVADAQANHAPWTGPELYGLAWAQQTYRGLHVFRHAGAVTGYGALMAYAPAADWAVAIMANTEVASNKVADLLLFRLLDDMLHVPPADRFNWTRHHDAREEEARRRRRNARRIVYPDAPPEGRALPPALPLPMYAGTYRDAGYGNLTLRLESRHPASPSGGGRPPTPRPSSPTASDDGDADPDPRNPSHTHLHADVLDRTWPHSICLEHVSGEHFLAWSRAPDSMPTALFDADLPTKAEFSIGVDGRVAGVAVQYEPRMGERRLWFAKVA